MTKRFRHLAYLGFGFVYLFAALLAWQVDTPIVQAQQAGHVVGPSTQCIQAWTGLLQNGPNAAAGLQAILAGACNTQQIGYVVPTYPHNPTDPMHNQFEPWYGRSMVLVVPPPFSSAILTPWGQLPPVDAAPSSWIILTNGMEASGVQVLKDYATYLRFWAFSPGSAGSCASMSIRLYPGDPTALHCAAFGDS